MQLMLLLLLLASQHASAVEVYEGVESVRLPCHVPADVALESTAAVWDREDLNIKIVHVRLRSSDDFKEQSIRYTNRTSMRADALQTGDLSLTLRNPTVSDSGTYKCTVRKYGRDQSKTYVDLKITVRPPPVWPIVLFALLVPVVLLAAAFGVFMYPRYKMLKMRKEYQLEMVEVTQGKEFVLLPFKIKEGFTQDVKVEWKHKNKMVHEYQIGKDQCHLKGQDQKQRTEMKKDPLNTKDLSLTLKDLHLTDSGVYTCTIYNKDGHMLLRKSVTLSVRVPEVQMVETVKGVQSVLLPFTTDIKLQDVTVEWKHEDRKVPQGRAEMKKDPLRTGDFSLTLKDLHLTDSGVYTCTVYNKDGHMLLQKAVTLSVRDYQSVVVEVTQGQKSVLMPFKITGELPQVIKVEWKLTHPEEKMVHCNDSSQKQDQVYVGRTEMPHYDLKSKDFSLTLKDLHLTDSGVYTCTVYNKDGHMLLQKSVTLSVRVPEVQMVETVKGVQSVLLPFTTDIKLQDVTVEWKHEDKKVPQGRAEMKKDPLRTGDFSLTLKDLHLTDSGVYTCTIYNKDGHMLLQKSVTLSVRVLQVEMVEVTQGEKSVLLPFRIKDNLPVDVTLLWRHENVTVHTYQRGQSQPDIQGRTEMKKDPLTTKDLSLTLKDLHLTDSGVYTCTVYNKDGHMLLQKVVTLSVRGDNKTTTTQAAENQHTKKSTGRLTSSTERKK
ncbi:muscle M-line assembly protein unc-89-like isoform X2 [Oreochromis aureus]|uniref:muscle M-line assembly protein unc-89-like isoform X2 n=1 Tax=Oreochromis aureus TaxID=47969 RepID=UPI0019533FDD|nr:muscle M-line assembly protein unc-89-like isoform X2 [Oreochromis aureus]